MSTRIRSFSIAACALAAGAVVTVAGTHPDEARPALAAGPPSTPPAEDGTGGVPGIELVAGLGNGAQPEGLPREIVVDGARYLFDRVVPLDRQELVRIAQEQEAIAYARTETAPFTAIYISVPGRSEDELARYLPEGVGSAEPCPAEAGNYDRVDAGGSLYAFAGVEADLTVDTLQGVGDSDGAPIYADIESTQPFPELFIGSGDGLLRFVVVGADGRPSSLAESLAFNGAEFTFDSDVTDAVDPSSLVKLGCSTAFPVYSPSGSAEGTTTELYVLAGTRWFRFIGEGSTPAPESTAEPTTTSTLASTTTTTLPPTTTTTTLPPTTTTTTLAPTTTTLPPTTTTTSTLPPTTTTTTLAPTTTSTLPPTTTTTSTLPPTTTTTTLPPTTSTLPPPTTTTLPPPTTTTLPPTTTTTTTTTSTLPPTTTAPATTTTTTTLPSTTTTTTSPPAATTSTAAPTTTASETTTTTEVIEPPAVVATLPPDAAPPAASNVQPTACTGDPGELDSRGLPQRLPSRIQLGGVAYVFAGTIEVDTVGTLSRIRCVGPFEAATSDQADQADVVYLRTTGATASEQVYRFEAVQTFQIEFQITDQAQVLTADDETYRLGQVWQPTIYSSTTVILFVEDPADPAPDTVYALDVSHSVAGDLIGEYRLRTDAAQTSEELRALAEAAGLNPDLTINGQDYSLVEVYIPAGTTNNGFVTLFGATSDATADLLLGRDQRERELFVFLLDTAGG